MTMKKNHHPSAMILYLMALSWLRLVASAASQENVAKNPYVAGCFQAKQWRAKKRVCNSDDPPNAARDGLCREPPIPEYMEIRIFCQDCESVLIETWVLQLLLSEILDVPTTVETGFYDSEVNFYDTEGRYDYAYKTQLDVFHSTYRGSMERGHAVGDCRKASRTKENYEECAHMVPEICQSETAAVIQDYVYNGIFDAPSGLGALGMESWFIPKFTAERDPTLISYLGMAGEHNRRKMAEMFKRPITWKTYCETVSSCNYNSTQEDPRAARPPQTPQEEEQYFAEGLYTGYFMATEKNDCSLNNGTTCTGVIHDYPCDWPSYIWEQTQYLNIALETEGPQPGNGGHTLMRLEEIWRAANATKSNVVMQWWTPQALHQLFHGTEAEFIKVNLPTPTEKCLRAREEGADRCSADYRTAAANLDKGSCDTLTGSLYKMKIANLFSLTYDSSIPSALQSPAYQALDMFQISENQLTEIFERWKNLGDPRDAVCEWAVENIDYLSSFVPNSYPRTIQEEVQEGALQYFATALAGFVMAGSLLSIVGVYQKRETRTFKVAQVEFVSLLLFGALCVSTASFVMVISASNATCVAVEWVLNLGYSLMLVPLMVKVSAINRLSMAAKKMKRIQLTRKTLYGAMMIIMALLAAFLAVWTARDPPKRQFDYVQTEDVTDDGEIVVLAYEYCQSKSDGWIIASWGWVTLLLLCETILAVQMRDVQSAELKESGTLAALVYSHSVFVLIRIILFFTLQSGDQRSLWSLLRSLIFSFDALSTILIYVVPKIFREEGARGSY